MAKFVINKWELFKIFKIKSDARGLDEKCVKIERAIVYFYVHSTFSINFVYST